MQNLINIRVWSILLRCNIIIVKVIQNIFNFILAFICFLLSDFTRIYLHLYTIIVVLLNNWFVWVFNWNILTLKNRNSFFQKLLSSYFNICTIQLLPCFISLSSQWLSNRRFASIYISFKSLSSKCIKLGNIIPIVILIKFFIWAIDPA
jgi:hypothetical protein